jgi:PKD repeat protein
MNSDLLKPNPMKINHYVDKLQVVALIAFTIAATISCKKLPEPSFSITQIDNPEAGETIQFINKSINATTYNWEFGDGGTSVLESPEYIFQTPGSYVVKLTAFNEDGEERTSQSITINQPTILGFQVFDSTGVNLLSGADVWIYDNEDDLLNLREPLFTGITDEIGEVVFNNMEPIVYYFLTVKSVPGGAWFFALSTPILDQNEENIFWFNCIWFPNEKKSTSIQEVLEYIGINQLYGELRKK